MKPVLKPPGSKILKLRCDGPLSNFAFNCNLRRYTTCVLMVWGAYIETAASMGKVLGQ